MDAKIFDKVLGVPLLLEIFYNFDYLLNFD